MLSAIEIKNFKSASKLKLKFGRVNVFIGENGSGKSTILEALTFVAAAEANKLDNEFLESRGIRVTSPKLMRSNFDEVSLGKPIEIKASLNDITEEGADGLVKRNRLYIINNDNETYSKWKLTLDTQVLKGDEEITSATINSLKERYKEVYHKISEMDENQYDVDKVKSLKNEVTNDDFLSLLNNTSDVFESKMSNALSFIRDFVIYSPQHKQLRNLKEEGQIRPLGIHGEGLFKLVREINDKQPKAMKDIQKGLKLIGWYKSMEVPDSSDLSDDDLLIKDKYLISSFTQKSANEGFLYVLFYLALMVSKDTPSIFAVDNIDTALNPKLCSKIMTYLSELAVKYNKQIFLTTQNPATLDGIDLYDEEQKLFIVSRGKKGNTRAKEFTSDKMPKTKNGEPIMLSEAMIRGYIGGIPKGF